MPTLIDIDGFAHQTAATTQSGSGFAGLYESVNPSTAISFDTTIKRLLSHVASLKIVEDGASQCHVERNIGAGLRDVNVSFYFRIAAAPGGTSIMFYLATASSNAQVRVTSGGVIQYLVNGGTAQSFAGNKADSAWHRLEIRFISSAATFTVDATLDGSAGTQASRGSQTAGDITKWGLGSTQTTDTLTFWSQDMVVSSTGADYPIGEHHVLPLHPTGEGTDNLLAHISDAGAGTTNLYQSVDDWNGGTPDTATYIAQTTIDTGAFAEFTLTAPSSESAIWDVIGYIAGFASTTGADTADLQVLTAHGGTLIDHIGNLLDYSGSTTVLGYFRHVLARISGGWTASNLGSSVLQWGRSTDVIGNPRLSAVMLEYAAPEVNATATPSTVTGTGAVPASTVTGGATPTPSSVVGVGDVPAPTVVAQAPATATPSTVVGTGSVPAPTTLAGAIPTPSSVAGVGAVPSPTVTGTSLVTPATVVGVGAVPSPTLAAAATPTPASVAGVGAVNAPTVNGTALATPATVVGVGAVPSPTILGSSLVTPATVVGVGAVPSPSVSGGALTTPATVIGVGAVPSPSVSGDALVAPSTVVGIGAVPAPTVISTTSTIATPSTVAGIGAVPSPSVHGDSNVTPSSVVGIGLVPSPTVTSDATATPSAVVGVGAVNAPSVHGDAKATPASVVGIGAVPSPSPRGDANLSPATVVGIGTVPSPTIHGAATPTPLTVAGYATIPSPTLLVVIARTRGFVSVFDVSIPGVETVDSAKFVIDTDNSSDRGVTIVEAVEG